MLKKITCFIAACLIFSFSVFAKDDFFVYGKDSAEVAKIFNMTETDLQEYCEDNGITYLAVNTDNTKQIKRAETEDDFSKEIFDLSLMSDDKIHELTAELSGFKNTSGSIVAYNNMKFLKTEHETEDSGGKFILTQYVTVENAQKTVLTFYTAQDTDRDYIESVFQEQFKPQKDYLLFAIIGVCVFSVLGVVVLVLIFKDFKKE